MIFFSLSLTPSTYCNDPMVPITLFKSGSEFGVLPSDELDDEDDLEIVHEYFSRGSH